MTTMAYAVKIDIFQIRITNMNTTFFKVHEIN